MLVPASHHSYKNLANIKTRGLLAESPCVDLSGGKSVIRDVNMFLGSSIADICTSVLRFSDLFS